MIHTKINPGWDEIFRPSRPALGSTQPPVKWVPGLSPVVKCGRGVLLTTHPLLVPRSWKSRAILLPNLWATPGLQRDHFTFTFTFTFNSLIKVQQNIQLKHTLYQVPAPTCFDTKVPSSGSYVTTKVSHDNLNTYLRSQVTRIWVFNIYDVRKCTV